MNYSQLGQDKFALSIAKNQSYIEIGAWKPEHYSNTYLLETNGWQGFSLEINKSKKELWDRHPLRHNTIYWTDALQFDYAKAIKENNMSKRIGYLSCDIEPVENTFQALQRVLNQGIIFDCITFEHDKYQSKTDYDPIVRNFLNSYGYKVAVTDVYRTRKYRINGLKKKINKKCHMETWFVKDDIPISMVNYDEWRERLR